MAAGDLWYLRMDEPVYSGVVLELSDPNKALWIKKDKLQPDGHGWVEYAPYKRPSRDMEPYCMIQNFTNPVWQRAKQFIGRTIVP